MELMLWTGMHLTLKDVDSVLVCVFALGTHGPILPITTTLSRDCLLPCEKTEVDRDKVPEQAYKPLSGFQCPHASLHGLLLFPHTAASIP